MILIFWILLANPTPSLAGPRNEVVVRIESKNSHEKVRQISLRKEKDGFRCRTPETPWHLIKPRGLESLESPVSANPGDVSGCERVLLWGKTAACFERNPFIEDLFRWCENL